MIVIWSLIAYYRCSNKFQSTSPGIWSEFVLAFGLDGARRRGGESIRAYIFSTKQAQSSALDTLCAQTVCAQSVCILLELQQQVRLREEGVPHTWIVPQTMRGSAF